MPTDTTRFILEGAGVGPTAGELSDWLVKIPKGLTISWSRTEENFWMFEAIRSIQVGSEFQPTPPPTLHPRGGNGIMPVVGDGQPHFVTRSEP